jgi:HSP20 family protein
MYWMNTMDPFTDLTRLEQWMDQSLKQVLSSFSPVAAQSNRFVPAVNVLDGADHLTVKAAMPGVNEEDINLTLEGNVLTIKAERRLPQGADSGRFHLMECSYGTFVRPVTLPDTVDPNAVHASYVNGILEINIGKRQEAKPKQIPVSLGKPRLAANGTA